MRALRWLVPVYLGLAVPMVASPPALAATAAPQLRVSPAVARAAERVTVSGAGYGRTNPIEIHWNSPSGPVLGSFRPTDSSLEPGQVIVPPDAAPGKYQIYATQQDLPDKPSTSIEVVLTSAQIPAQTATTQPLIEEERGEEGGTSLAVVAVIMVVVLGAVILAGALITRRRRATP
ncbi:MAG: hypothetical protein ACRD12_14810 [Acidimicrobiales bacterium]